MERVCGGRYHYCLQLNIYAHVLESEYGMTVSSMYLGVVHPTAAPRVLEVPRLNSEINVLVEHEKTCGRATEPTPGVRAPFLLL